MSKFAKVLLLVAASAALANAADPVGDKPSSKPVATCRELTDAQKETCKRKLVPDCADGKFPTRDADCCITCRPPEDEEDEGEKRCSEDAMENCRKGVSMLAECAANVKPMFNTTSCCPNCKPVARPEGQRPSKDGKCDKDAIQKCYASADIPVCTRDGAEDKIPVDPKTSCCKVCKRPERKCNQEEVAKSCADKPDCAAGEDPVTLEGSCCKSCKKPRPTCAPACAANEVCTRGKKDAKETLVCKAKVKKGLKLQIGDAKRKAQVDGMTTEQLTALIKEIINRFCDAPQNVERCKKHQQNALDAVSVTKTGSDADSVSIEVATTETDEPTARRLLATDSAAQLTVDALADPDAAAGMQTASKMNSATTTAPTLLAAVFAAITFVFRA